MKRVVWAALTAVVSVVLLMGFVGQCSAVEYRMHVLDPLLARCDSCAFDINNNQMIVGQSYFICYWDAAGVHDFQRAFGGSMSMTVNDAGKITTIPMVYANGTWSWLPTLSGTGSNRLYGVDSAGNVVGVSNVKLDNGTYMSRACVWDSAGAHDLGTLLAGEASIAYGINNNGQIVGVSGDEAFIWQDNKMSGLGTLPGYDNSCAWRINNHGQIIGWCVDYTHPSPKTAAFLWQGDAWTPIGADYWTTYTMDINDLGQVVGYYSPGSGHSAYVWQGGAMTTLPGLGRGDDYAYGINERGWIVGRSMSSDGYYHAVVWEPVPEPSAAVVLLSGMGALVTALRRRR